MRFAHLVLLASVVAMAAAETVHPKAAAATSFADGHPAMHAIDGLAATYWEGGSKRASITFDYEQMVGVITRIMMYHPASPGCDFDHTLKGSTDGMSYFVIAKYDHVQPDAHTWIRYDGALTNIRYLMIESESSTCNPQWIDILTWGEMKPLATPAPTAADPQEETPVPTPPPGVVYTPRPADNVRLRSAPMPRSVIAPAVTPTPAREASTPRPESERREADGAAPADGGTSIGGGVDISDGGRGDIGGTRGNLGGGRVVPQVPVSDGGNVGGSDARDNTEDRSREPTLEPTPEPTTLEPTLEPTPAPPTPLPTQDLCANLRSYCDGIQAECNVLSNDCTETDNSICPGHPESAAACAQLHPACLRALAQCEEEATTCPQPLNAPPINTCGWNCSTDCLRCTARNVVGNTQFITVDMSTCQGGNAIDWSCCKNANCGVQFCDGTKNGDKCEAATTVRFGLPATDSTLQVQVHDGQLDGNVDCSGNACCGAAGSSCKAGISGVCNFQLQISSCPIS